MMLMDVLYLMIRRENGVGLIWAHVQQVKMSDVMSWCGTASAVLQSYNDDHHLD